MRLRNAASGRFIHVARPTCHYGPCARRTKRAGDKYCSRACSATDRIGRPVNPSAITAAVDANRQRTATRIGQLIIEDCRPFLDADQRMPLSAVGHIILKHRRLAYQRGWSAYYQRHLRHMAARQRV